MLDDHDLFGSGVICDHAVEDRNLAVVGGRVVVVWLFCGLQMPARKLGGDGK